MRNQATHYAYSHHFELEIFLRKIFANQSCDLLLLCKTHATLDCVDLPHFLIFSFQKDNHGGYSSMVEHWFVVPSMRVRFPLVAQRKSALMVKWTTAPSRCVAKYHTWRSLSRIECACSSMDRALGFGPRCCRFESCQAHLVRETKVFRFES